MRLGGDPRVDGGRALWERLQARIGAVDYSGQMELSVALSEGRAFDELPPWARALLVRVWEDLP
jgi:hypothetical protein